MVQAAKNLVFIGLGQMGYPLASQLAKAGHTLFVSDVSEERVSSFLHEHSGAAPLGSADWNSISVLFTSLPNSDIVESVLLGDDGVVTMLPAGRLIADLSSSDPIRSQALGERLESKGLRYVDAPVSGGVKGALAGTLSVMVGGDDAGFSEVQPLVESFADKIFHVGPVGTGHAAKALNNLVSAASMGVTIEALLTGEKFGINPHTLNSIFNASSGKTNASENKVEQFILSETYASGFGLQLMAKDVHIAVALAHKVGQAAVISEACDELWADKAANADRSIDHTQISQFMA